MHQAEYLETPIVRVMILNRQLAWLSFGATCVMAALYSLGLIASRGTLQKVSLLVLSCDAMADQHCLGFQGRQV